MEFGRKKIIWNPLKCLIKWLIDTILTIFTSKGLVLRAIHKNNLQHACKFLFFNFNFDSRINPY